MRYEHAALYLFAPSGVSVIVATTIRHASDIDIPKARIKELREGAYKNHPLLTSLPCFGMKSITSSFLLLLALAVVNAFPAAIFDNPAVHDSLIRAANKPIQRRSNSSLANLVNGILNGSLPGVPFPNFNLPLGLGSLVLEVPPVVAIGRKAIPDVGHPFKAPEPTDQRGGCPGLNIMANYGYIPRNGIATLTQLLWGQQEMLGIGPDLAAVLVAFAAIAAVDPTTLKVSIGNVDSRTSGLLSVTLGQAPGIFDKVSHNEYEVDGSTAYTDSYFVPDGTTNHFNSSKWATAIQIAEENGGVFGPDWLATIRYRRYTDCVNTNPSPDKILFYAANGLTQSIIPYSDENGVPTSPTIAAVSSFFGVQDNGDGTYSKVPEKLLPGPDGVCPDQIGNVTAGPSPFCLAFTEMQDLIPSYLKPVQNAIPLPTTVMKLFSATYISLLALEAVHAFPAAMFNNPAARSHLFRAVERDVESRGSSLGDLVNGILNGSLPGVKFPEFTLPLGLGPIVLEVPPVVTIGRKVIPDADHPFQAPGPTDQRGGCPGLNIMANYGYISRTGITNPTEILWAAQEMLGIGTVVASALVGVLAISALDVTSAKSLKASIGLHDVRTNGPLSLVLGQIPGLFDKAAHGEFEMDGSIAYTDSAFTSDGNTKTFNSTKWATVVEIAQQNGGIFGADWIAAVRYNNYNDCVHTNPECSWEEKEILFYIGDCLTQTVMASSDENGVVGPPTIEAISTFFGVHDNGDGTYSKVPEMLPVGPDGNWYRRSIPLSALEILHLGLDAYLANPVIFGSNSGTPNSFTGSPDQIGSVITSPNPLCFAFNEVFDIVRDELEGRSTGGANDVRARDLAKLGNLVNGILNGSLPGVPFPNFNLPLTLGNILLEVPPVVAIGRKAIPDEQHSFQTPGPTDQRGGCPGLNIMANYGYISHTGVTTATELLWAQQEMLGLAPDLAAALVALSAISAMDPTT
ncbi:hypothetical protein HWV62_20830 [Athelia sp. TMB]|nr:hypothetical protein HWV62_20830 [Athelia sp. TMB]